MAAFSLAVYFLLLHVSGVFGEQYTVTVITDPPSGPFMTGNRIDFTCHVYPLPSEPVTYSWHAMTNANGPTTLSGQNTTHYTPSVYRDLHFSWFFCKVFSNETLISVGRRLVEIHGFVFSVEPLFRTFVLGSTIELQVNISNDYSATKYIRTLVWFHNGTEIQASGRVSVLNNGRTITIRDTTHTDAGYYRVEIASLDFNDPVCDSLWLPLLRNHAAHAPVTFTIRLMNESLPSKCCTDEHQYTKNIPQQYYPLVNNSSTLFAISHNTDLSSSWTMSTTTSAISYLSSSLSVNGSRLVSGASKLNLSQTAMESGVLTQMIDFRYNFSDEGFYVHSLYFSDLYYLLHVGDEGRLRRYRCLNYYDYADNYLRQISFVIFPFLLTTYKPPTQINISSLYFAESGLTQLVCTATGGVPDSHNITLFHSNQDQQLLATNMGNELQSYIDLDNFLGEFICTVKSLYGTKQVSLLLYEKATFQLLLAVNKRMDQVCIQVTKSNKVNESTLHEDIRNLFKTVCDCTVDLEQVKVDCFTTGNMLLSGTVVYSNSEGNVTASTLLDMLQVWLLTTTDDPILMLQHQPFKLISQCPIRLSSATVDVCHNLTLRPFSETATQVTNDSAPIIGGSFIGGVLTGIMACLITLFIGLCVLKVKADMSMRKAGSTSEMSQTVNVEDVVMDTNQAYETVEMRYRYQSAAASRSRPPVGLQEREEPVYENH